MEVSYRAIHVWRRDLRVYRATWWTNAIPPIFEPILYLLAFGAGVGALIQKPISYGGRDVSYVAFIAPGLIAVTIMFWAFFETLYASFIRMYYQKTFDAIVATPLSLDDVIAGEILWGATKSVGAAVLMLGVIAMFGVLTPTALLVIPFAALAGLFFAALGMIFTAVCPTIDSFNLPIFLFIYPMFLFGGTFFPIEVLPGWARVTAQFLPLTHVASFVRGVCLGHFGGFLWIDLAYLGAGTPILCVAALILMRRRLIH
jgi:lipooligosaccharide transport system permease protein